jgi:histidinol-phosphatase (PHP family)
MVEQRREVKGNLMQIKWDGHTHSKFCRHGSPAELSDYLKRAIEHGFERYTISEHPPLPDAWVNNPALVAELAMQKDELPAYVDYVLGFKECYADQIEITCGLEMDYLYRNEAFSDRMVEKWAHILEDIVVSVHYLPGSGGMRCIDFTADDFKDAFLKECGSINRVVDEYYDHVEMAIEWARKLPMRKRLGHINLIEKFSCLLPEIDKSLIQRRLEGILPKLKAANLAVDVNVAGIRVPTCGHPYIPSWFISACRKNEIELVYGSDAHRPEHVGEDWDWFETHVVHPDIKE